MASSVPLYRRLASASFPLFLAGLSTAPACAQAPQARIVTAIDNASRVTLANSRPPAASSARDLGQVPPSTTLPGITIVFSRSAAQQLDLETLIAAQQNPASAQYHQWLTPDAFAARFGAASSDLNQVQTWLESQGFTVNGVARSRDRISFAGTEAQVESAFGTPLHYYQGTNAARIAPAADLTIPSALAGVVLGVDNLSGFRPQPQIVKSQFTSSQTGSHFLTSKDVATIYDVNAAYSAGYNGVNQTIAVVGQSAVVLADVTRYQTLVGANVRNPTLVLVPNTGASTIYTGDEAESDLDLEYTSTMAPGANILFVYTGSSGTAGAFNALQYAITERVAPIISVSYGSCEAALGASNFAILDQSLAQAAAQGQTVVAAAGDQGSESCSGDTALTTAQQAQVSALYPASSQYVTGMGGTEFPSTAVAAANATYFTPSTGTDVIGSALSYIPEQVWNDDSSTALSAGGGGISIFSPRPSWQAGVPGIPTGSFRLVPDISLTSSPNNAGYLYCSSDTATGITGSCSNGFRDVNTSSLTVAGGTSFAAPVFAGMLALINQAKSSAGEGVINPTLYGLAANATTYANAFHDITSGTNACTSSSTTLCSTAGAAVYASGVGYDEASGLGSIDLYKLLSVWPSTIGTTTSGTALASTTTTPAAATSNPAVSAADVITVTVARVTTTTGTTSPTGTVSIVLDGSAVSTLTLSGGTTTYSFSSASAGAHVIVATYSGDGTYAPSSGTTAVTVGAASGTFQVAVPALTITDGSTATDTVTVTPSGGYTGTVSFLLSGPSSLTNACYGINNLAVPGTTAVTTTLTIATSSATCSGAIFLKSTGQSMHALGKTARLDAPVLPGSGGLPSGIPAGAAFAGLVLAGYFGRRKGWSRQVRGLLSLTILAVAGMGLVGCGDGSGPSSSTVALTYAPKGTYSLTLTGTDVATGTISSSATFTLTVQ